MPPLEAKPYVIVDQVDSGLTVVSKDLFFDGQSLPADVFLKLSTGKYLVLGKAGTKGFFSDFKSYANPNSEIFVLNSDMVALLSQINNFSDNIIEHKNIKTSIKVKFLNGLMHASMHDLLQKKVANTNQAKKTAELFTKFSGTLDSFPEAVEALLQFPAQDTYHAVTTCVIALLIAKEMRINMRVVQERIALAALIHDIGLRFIPQEILDKAPRRRSALEQAIYQSHPAKAVEYLQGLKDIPQDILLMIAEHHENAIGTGYPRKLKDVQISPLGRIMIVADFFSELMFPSLDNSGFMTADIAIEYIEKTLQQPFNKQVFMALKKAAGGA